MLKAAIKRQFFNRKGNFEKFSGVLPVGAQVNGDIFIDGDQTLVIDGTVNGNIKASDSAKEAGLIISGAVAGEISGFTYILIDGGNVIGSVSVKKTVALKNIGVITGDVSYTELVIETGSLITGKLTPHTEHPKVAG